jgi:hypothetical protein
MRATGLTMLERNRRSRRRWRTASLVLLVAIVGALAAACGGGDESATPPEQPAAVETGAPAQSPSEPAPGAEPPDSSGGGAAGELPPAVAAAREAIVAAAHARDYDGLEDLLDPATFTYSFGESGDPVGYWRHLEDEGEVPILGDVLPTVLSMNVARSDDLYVWPAAHAKDPAQWTEADLADLRLLYSEDDIASFEELGGYLGYRVGIREDGTWLFFVAGD